MTEAALNEQTTWDSLLENPWVNLEKLNPELTKRPDFQEVSKWYLERVKLLPTFQEEPASLADGAPWTARLGDGGRVEKIEHKDGIFFEITGRKLRKINPDGSVYQEWTQPVYISKENEMAVNLFGKEITIPVNGFLGVIPDTDGRILSVVDQEAVAETPNHAIIRLAIQASAGKIALMRSGKPEADKQLFELLKIYCGGEVENLLKSVEFILPIPPEDTNRDIKHNLVLVMPPIEMNSALHKALEANGMRKWLSREQLAMVNLARLTNSHTTAAIRISEDARLLGSSTK